MAFLNLKMRRCTQTPAQAFYILCPLDVSIVCVVDPGDALGAGANGLAHYNFSVLPRADECK